MALSKQSSVTYAAVGDNYDTKDPIKKLAQSAAKKTAKNLLRARAQEVPQSRGESAYVWQQGSQFMASVIEGLGTKNLVADNMRQITKRTYYDVIGHDTVATIINDLITVGAKPLVLHAYWAIEDNTWLQDEERMADLISGWKRACDISGASWGGGETPTLKGITVPGTVDLGGCAIGIIKTKKRLVIDENLQAGDRIILLKSNGINANGVSLARAIAKKVARGYAEKLSDGTYYGEALLTKTNIYASVVQDILDAGIPVHYISNITGHGMRKIMRARGKFTYIIEKMFQPQEVFLFIQKHANISDYEVYQTYNMGNDYAIFVAKKDVETVQQIVRKNKFQSIDAGFIEYGKRQVVLKEKNLTFAGETLDLR